MTEHSTPFLFKQAAAEDIVFQDAVNCAESILCAYFLSFVVGAAIIGYANFIYPYARYS
jgi:hypothetical protein